MSTCIPLAAELGQAELAISHLRALLQMGYRLKLSYEIAVIEMIGKH